MMNGVRALGAALLLLGLELAVACSSASSSDGASAGNGGSSDDAGSSPGAGRAGSANRAGATGRAGANGRAGSDDGGASSSDAGAAGEGGTADPCVACPSGACLPSGECVECVATNDQCPVGKYCAADNTCVAGCKNDASCASGVCGEDHDCQSCIADLECNAEHVCGNNQCAERCTAAQEGGNAGCGAGLTCCSEHCVDAQTDAAHCGACGTACATDQFCGLTGCAPNVLASLCSIGKIAVVLDGQSGNETPGRAIAQALKTKCAPAPSVREVSQTVADVVNATTGRPVAGGDELLVVAGGSFFARLTGYVNDNHVSPLYSQLVNDTLEFRRRANDELVASAPFSGPHDTHDVFIIQFMRDAASGSLVLNAQGFWQEGTTAAAFYLENVLLPSAAPLDKAWYAVEWIDADADLLPDLNEFEAIASGN